MTRQTMLEAAARLPRSPLYGIGVARSGDDYIDYEIGWDDFARDTDWAHAQLVAAGVTGDDHVLVTTPNHEAPQMSPIVHALRRIGATYTPTETYGWDVNRFLSILRSFPVTVVIGLGEETLGAISSQVDDLRAEFAKVRLLWARSGPHATLTNAGIPSIGLELLGPALGLAVPSAPHDLQVNAAEWQVTAADDGSLSVAGTHARHDPVPAIPTGLSGTLTHQDENTTLVRIGAAPA